MKNTVGIIELECCYGCKSTIINSDTLGNNLQYLNLHILDERTSLKEFEKIDYFIIIGNPIKENQQKMLKNIPKNKNIILLGTCTNKNSIYDFKIPFDYAKFFEVNHNKILKKVFGCPIEKSDFDSMIRELTDDFGKIKDTKSVCFECTMNQNNCILEKGNMCLGPVTISGCDSICLNHKASCKGCRSILSEENTVKTLNKIISEKSKKDAEDLLNFFNKERGV